VITGFLLLQAAWVFTIPPFRGSDEVDHAYRAAAVARGEWVAGPPAADGRGWLVTVPGSLVTAAFAQCDYLGYQRPDNCSAVASVSDGNVLIASSAAGYHPAYYWVVGRAGLPFEGAASLYAMRVASALWCLLFLGLAAWAMSKLPSRWPTAGLVLAASPVLLYSTAIVAPNGLEMSVALSFWASLLAISHGQDESMEHRLLWIAIASGVLLGTLRLLGPLFILLILATIAALRWTGLLSAIRRRPRTVVLGCVLVGTAVAGLVLWTFSPIFSLEPGTTRDNGADSFKPLNLVFWPMQTIAVFPYRDQMGPVIIYLVVMALVLALMQFAVRRASRIETIIVLGSLIVSLALPLVLTVATIESHGLIWQGRYGLPYSVGFVLVAGYVVGVHARSSELPWKLTVPTLTVYGVAVAACLLKVRADELSENWASRGDPSWHQPSPLLLGLLVGLAMLCVAASLSRWSREPS
jgi:hypothetical protein